MGNDMSRLIHYSDKHLIEVYSVPLAEQSSHRGGLHKPRGLWVSVEGENDWKEWCEGERFGCLDCATEIILAADANVLWLVGSTELDQFHAEYSVVAYRYGGNLGVRTAIEWPRVAGKYQGIIIAPYVYARRLEEPVSDWYYGWDCASGCIWDAAVVAKVRPIPEAVAA